MTDAAGQMIRRVRPDGTAALNEYDARGRLLSVKWDGDRAAPSEFAYDAAGHMTLARNPSASVERAYTATGRLAGETQVVTLEGAAVKPEKSAIGYAYDADGRLSVITYPDGSKVQHFHNGRGELTEILDSQPLAGGKEPKANARYTYTRRADGKIEKLTHPNGVTTTRDYDAVGRLAKISHLDPSGKVLESEASTYDPRDCSSLRSRPAKWLRFEDTAIAVEQLLHDATRKYTWDADIHLMSVTTAGHREPQRSEE